MPWIINERFSAFNDIYLVLKEKVISKNVDTEDGTQLSNEAKRPSRLPLFPNATVNKKYYIEVKAQLKTETKDTILELINTNGDVVCIRLFLLSFHYTHFAKKVKCS